MLTCICCWKNRAITLLTHKIQCVGVHVTCLLHYSILYNTCVHVCSPPRICMLPGFIRLLLLKFYHVVTTIWKGVLPPKNKYKLLSPSFKQHVLYLAIQYKNIQGRKKNTVINTRSIRNSRLATHPSVKPFLDM